MATLDSLPADQRAVLQLVLQRGRGYDQIAQMLSIDRAGVRDRALAAFDALGPQTRVEAGRRALITDYLLGQLPPRVAEDTREHLARSASERAWARVLASELASLAPEGLPEIPAEAADAEPEREREPRLTPAAAPTIADEPPVAPRDPGVRLPRPPRARPARPRPRSRFGGAILLAGGSAIVLLIVIVVIASSGSSSKHTTSTSTPSTGASTPTTSTTGARVVAQINLVPASGTSKAAGIAEILKQGANDGIAIVAQNIPPNTKHNAYAVWLYNSPTDSHILGFVNPGVGANGRLSTAGGLPANAGHFKQLIVTMETQANPRVPGQIILQGTLTGLA